MEQGLYLAFGPFFVLWPAGRRAALPRSSALQAPFTGARRLANARNSRSRWVRLAYRDSVGAGALRLRGTPAGARG